MDKEPRSSEKERQQVAEEVEHVVGLLQTVWESIGELVENLDPESFDLPTDCPGWSVKDQISHIIGTESLLLGRPAPSRRLEPKPWVKNRIGELNELWVDEFRDKHPSEVVKTFREVTASRLDSLRSMEVEEFERETMTPTGPGTYLEFMRIRIFDCWVHEQDIRRAVGRPGHLGGPVARHSVERCFQAMGYVVGKKVGAPDATVVAFEVLFQDGGDPASTAVRMTAGRGVRLDAVPAECDVVISAAVDVFTGLCCGRFTYDRAAHADAVRIRGDVELGHAVLDNLAFMI